MFAFLSGSKQLTSYEQQLIHQLHLQQQPVTMAQVVPEKLESTLPNGLQKHKKLTIIESDKLLQLAKITRHKWLSKNAGKKSRRYFVICIKGLCGDTLDLTDQRPQRLTTWTSKHLPDVHFDDEKESIDKEVCILISQFNTQLHIKTHVSAIHRLFSIHMFQSY